MSNPRAPFVPARLLPLCLLVACSSGGGGSSTPAQAGFRVTGLSTPQGAIWQINREIEIAFNFPVDFTTVSANTINIRSDSGVPATGAFQFKRVDTDGNGVPDTTDERVIVFQPNCPTKSDLSDAGLNPGGVNYTITLVGRTSGTTNTVRSSDGRALEETQERRFSTPNSLDPGVIFIDKTFGPPTPVVRDAGSTVKEGVSYVEIGGNADPDSRIYFEFDATTQTFSSVPGANAPSQVPLNLYSEAATGAAVVIEFNQAVNTSSTNISERRLRLEYQDVSGTWIPVDTRVQLIANCTQSGARVKLEPIGILPPDSRFRAVVLPGFKDIVGENVLTPVDGFAIAPTQPLNYSSLLDPDDGADEFFESFDFGGLALQSFEDTEALFDAPEAAWRDGQLTAAFDFQGTGGPGGNFDWVVRKGQTFVFDTTSTSIVGGPNGIPTTVQIATGGVVDVRNLIVEQGGVLRVQGINTMLVNATGRVEIDGEVDVSGFNAKDVATLNTGQQPETGGAGAAGGGRGGNASEIITNSTPRGGTGYGPFGEPLTGGQGGESGYAPFSKGKDARRPGGGGGGRFAADFIDNSGLFAEQGYPGHPESRGAETNQKPALGGVPGRGPFVDATTENDFFGVKPIVQPDGMGGFTLTGLVRGELTRIWAGYGGGGGGDALPSHGFPTPRWNPGSDEKGGGGGGGGGGLRVRALGPIVFGPQGRIKAEGGHGGTGENTNFLDHVGGTGGSGSGGHVILESAVLIDLVDGDPAASPSGPPKLSVRGGPTYIGSNNPRDNIPKNMSYGGSGGPGVIQLHVPSLNPPSDDPNTSNIIVATEDLVDPNPLGLLFDYSKPPATQMIPTFGARSKARSRWISLGGADVDPAGGNKLVQFLFDGVETTPGPDQGKLLVSNGAPDELAPLLGPETIGTSTVALLSNGVTLRIVDTSLDPLINDPGPISRDVYLRTPALLRQFLVRVNEVGNTAKVQDFDVVSATYDDASRALQITVDPIAGTIQEFVDETSSSEYTLVPRFFRVATDGVRDVVPDNSYVRILFDAAPDDGLGSADESNLLVQGGTIEDFNALSAGELKFFRFEIEFNLDAAAVGISPGTKPISLEFLRIPFRF